MFVHATSSLTKRVAGQALPRTEEQKAQSRDAMRAYRANLSADQLEAVKKRESARRAAARAAARAVQSGVLQALANANSSSAVRAEQAGVLGSAAETPPAPEQVASPVAQGVAAARAEQSPHSAASAAPVPRPVRLPPVIPLPACSLSATRRVTRWPLHCRLLCSAASLTSRGHKLELVLSTEARNGDGDMTYRRKNRV